MFNFVNFPPAVVAPARPHKQSEHDQETNPPFRGLAYERAPASARRGRTSGRYHLRPRVLIERAELARAVSPHAVSIRGGRRIARRSIARICTPQIARPHVST